MPWSAAAALIRAASVAVFVMILRIMHDSCQVEMPLIGASHVVGYDPNVIAFQFQAPFAMTSMSWCSGGAGLCVIFES